MSIRYSRRVFVGVCALPLLAVWRAPLAAQLHPDVDGRRLRLATDTLLVTDIAGGTERPGGLAISTLGVVAADELEMTYRWRPASGDSAVIVARLKRRSLEVVREQRRYADGGTVLLAYTPWGVRVESVHPSRGRERYPADSAARGTYPSTTVDLVLRALPLAAGYRVDLPVFFPSGIGRWRLQVRVVGTEMVTTRRGLQVECWVVEADFPGPATERFWIARDSRDLIRVLGHTGPDELQRYDR